MKERNSKRILIIYVHKSSAFSRLIVKDLAHPIISLFPLCLGFYCQSQRLAANLCTNVFTLWDSLTSCFSVHGTYREGGKVRVGNKE